MNLKFLKVKALLVAVILSSVFVSCTKEDEKQTELTAKEVNEIVSFNPLKGLFIHDELSKPKSNRLAKRGGDNSSGCNLISTIKTEIRNGVFRYEHDFGSGCELLGKTFKGKLIVEHEFVKNGLLIVGFKKTVEYKGFVSDGIELSGTSEYEATLKDKKTGHLKGSVGYDFLVTLEDGTKLEKSGGVGFEKVAGNRTPLYFKDDIYEITGKWKYLSFNGSEYSVKITKPLKRKSLTTRCWDTIEGVIEIQKGSKKHILDFGNGECDGIVTLDGKEL